VKYNGHEVPPAEGRVKPHDRKASEEVNEATWGSCVASFQVYARLAPGSARPPMASLVFGYWLAVYRKK
jgi:hypothetical protein